MNIIVCVKQVPDTNEVSIDPKTGTLQRDGVPSIINPEDKNALEAALKIKEQRQGVRVTALCMGPAQAETALREALAMGADAAVLLSDRAFAGSDTWATSLALAAAIQKLGGADLILCGRQAIDGDTAQVGPQLAQKLDIPQITCAISLELDGDVVRCRQEREEGCRTVEAQLPCLVTVADAANAPRYPAMSGVYGAWGKQMLVLTGPDIGVEPGQVGLAGSPTKVHKTFAPEIRAAGRMLAGTPQEAAAQLVAALEQRGLARKRGGE